MLIGNWVINIFLVATKNIEMIKYQFVIVMNSSARSVNIEAQRIINR